MAPPRCRAAGPSTATARSARLAGEPGLLAATGPIAATAACTNECHASTSTLPPGRNPGYFVRCVPARWVPSPPSRQRQQHSPAGWTCTSERPHLQLAQRCLHLGPQQVPVQQEGHVPVEPAPPESSACGGGMVPVGQLMEVCCGTHEMALGIRWCSKIPAEPPQLTRPAHPPTRPACPLLCPPCASPAEALAAADAARGGAPGGALQLLQQQHLRTGAGEG